MYVNNEAATNPCNQHSSSERPTIEDILSLVVVEFYEERAAAIDPYLQT